MDKITQREIQELKKLIAEQTKLTANLRGAIAKLHQETIRNKIQLKRTAASGNRNRKDIQSILQSITKR